MYDKKLIKICIGYYVIITNNNIIMNIINFPKEIIIEIFGKLDLKNLINMESVCHILKKSVCRKLSHGETILK